MADDLGYADLSCYGRRDYVTPALDRLAMQGIRFTSAYSNSPVCSATRTALMTGRYQYRLPVGLEEPLAGRPVGLPPTEMTLPKLLKSVGYRTALVGKWHLGALPDYGPLKSGYDRFWGFRGGGVDYFTHSFAGRHDLWDGDVEVHETGYLTTLLADRAIGLLREWSVDQRPFMLSLHVSAPHWPWEAPSDRAESERLAGSKSPGALAHYDGGNLAIYAKIVTHLDAQVDRVLVALDRLGLADDTIVVFTSDNGGERFSDTWPFSGRKTELLEGGIRVPAILRWPRIVGAGQVSATPVMTMDWLPTLAAMVEVHGVTAVQSDGVNILKTSGAVASIDRPLFWRYKALDQRACRLGRLKYLRMNGNEFLFDVVADPLERANLRQREPAAFERLKQFWDTWNKGMLEYDAQSYSYMASGEVSADRMGVTEASAANRR